MTEIRKLPKLEGGIGKALETLRTFHGISQREVCRGTGDRVTSAGLSQIERGDVKDPNPRLLRMISRVLEVPVIALFAAAGWIDKHDIEDLIEDPNTVLSLIPDTVAEPEEELIIESPSSALEGADDDDTSRIREE